MASACLIRIHPTNGVWPDHCTAPTLILPSVRMPYPIQSHWRIARPRGRRGFIILFGWRGITSGDGRPPASGVCPNCRQTTQLVGKKQRTWFTLFFIPIFPVSGATHFVQCSSCGAAFSGDLEQIQRGQAMADASLYQRGIALYNSLRASPGDSALLNQLMDHYGMMGEFDEAMAAARHFPE